MHDHSGADETDAGQGPLHHAAGGVGTYGVQLLDHADGHRRAEGNQRVGTQPGRAVVQLTVEADQAAEQGGEQQIGKEYELIELARKYHQHGRASSGTVLAG
ncbi:hypothetical protein D3C78_1113600 [compost metagenome]